MDLREDVEGQPALYCHCSSTAPAQAGGDILQYDMLLIGSVQLLNPRTQCTLLLLYQTHLLLKTFACTTLHDYWEVGSVHVHLAIPDLRVCVTPAPTQYNHTLQTVVILACCYKTKAQAVTMVSLSNFKHPMLSACNPSLHSSHGNTFLSRTYDTNMCN